MDDADSTGTSETVYSFQLDGTSMMVITADDADLVLYTAGRTRWHEKDPAELLEAFKKGCGIAKGAKLSSVKLSKAQFDSCIRDLVPGASIGPEDKQVLGHVLSVIFLAFGKWQGGIEGKGKLGAVALTELMCGLSLLCKGSKSSKLSWAFQLFDEDNDGFVTPAAVQAYLASFLTAMCACSAQGQGMQSNAMRAIINKNAKMAVQDLVGGTYDSADPGASVTFENIGDWYNSGGFEVIPWLELLDLSKWGITYRYGGEDSESEASPSPRKATLAGSKLKPSSLGAAARDYLVDGEEEDEEDEEELELEEDEEDDYDSAADGQTNGMNGDAEGGASVAFQFQMGWEQHPVMLTITEEDVAAVLELAALTGLAGQDPKEVGEVFVATSAAGQTLSKPGFDSCVRHLVPAERLTTEQKRDFSNLLSAAFMAFDRDDSGTADALELASGFSLLCAGNKSAKLAFAFELLDEDADEYLDRRGLWRFLRSVLSMLLGLSTGAAHLSSQELVQAIDTAAIWTSAQIFEDADLAQSDKISFDELAAWYTEGGFKVAPWLELLDLRKWGAGAAASLQSRLEQQEEEQGEEDGEVEEDEGEGDEDDGTDALELEDDDLASTSKDEVLFTFPLGPSINLTIQQEDVDFIERVAVITRLAITEPEHVLSVLTRNARPGPKGTGGALTLWKPEFDRSVRELVPEAWLTEDDKNLLSFALSNIFYAYDRDQSGAVPLRDLQMGFSFLCMGSKSSKLSSCFQLFDVSGGGRIPKHSVRQFVAGLLTVLCSCLGQMLELTNPEMWEIVDYAADFVMFSLFEDDDSLYSGRASLTFEEFGAWYNEGGFEIAPWLELLDLTKWVPGASTVLDIQASNPDLDLFEGHRPSATGHKGSSGGALAASAGGGTAEEDMEAAVMESPAKFFFQVSESAVPVNLLITEADVQAVLELIRKTRLCDQDPREVCTLLLTASTDGELDKRGFDLCIRKLVPATTLGEKEKSSFSVLLTSVFNAFDRDNTSSVDAVELACGFTLLCRGSKSAKLAFAFELLDEDGDDLLSRRGLWRYTRSFLTTLMALSFAATALSAEELTHAVDDGAVWTSARIFAQAGTASPNKISFDEFAAWYTDGGYRVSPWLELLDLKKWAAADQQE